MGSPILDRIFAELPQSRIDVWNVQAYRWAEGERISPHAHSNLYQLDLFSGSGGVVRINGTEHALSGRRLSFIPPHTEHSFTGSSRLRSFGFKARIEGSAALAGVPAFCVRPPSDRRADQLERDLRIILEEWQVGAPGSALATRTRILTALIDALRIWADATNESEPASREIVRDACRFMAVAYSEPTMAIADVARHCGIRADSLSRAFQHTLGVAPREYLMNLRIKQACVLLKCGSSVKETARQTGFNSIHYFSRAFSKSMRQNPTTWRTANRATTLRTRA